MKRGGLAPRDALPPGPGSSSTGTSDKASRSRFCLAWNAVKSSPGGSVESRREERELFFWTARQTLKLVMWTAVTIYFVASLIQGEPAGMRELLQFTSRVVALFR